MIRDILLDEADETEETDGADRSDEELSDDSGFGFVTLTTSVLANEAMILPCRYQIASASSQTSSASITRPSFKCNSSARATVKFATEPQSHRDRKREWDKETRGKGEQ